MTTKVKATYLSIISILVIAGYWFAFEYWWVDMNPQFPVFVGAGIVWIGAIYFGFFIARLTSFKDLGNHYIGLIQLTDTDFLKDRLDFNISKRLRTLSTIYSFTLFFILIAIFFKHTRLYEGYQLNQYGVSQKVIVQEITHINGRLIIFEFTYNQKEYQKYLHSDKYNIGDTVHIKFSTQDPYIASLDTMNMSAK